MDRSDNFQIHCRAYRIENSRSHNPQIPRYWITIGKGEEQKIIWDIPKDLNNPHRYWEVVPAISDLIAEYINTPRNEVKSKVFDSDKTGLTDILKRYDRRFK